MLGGFVRSNAYDVHMIMGHISESTLYTPIEFHMCSSPILLAVYEVLEKSEHFLNFQHKWVNQP